MREVGFKRLKYYLSGKASQVASAFWIGVAFAHDALRYLRFSISIHQKGRQRKKTIILLLSHALEKGLSFENRRPGFGVEKAIDLLDNISRYLSLYHHDWVTDLGTGVLQEYLAENILPSEHPTALRISEFLERNKTKYDADLKFSGGTKRPSTGVLESIRRGEVVGFDEIMKQRASFRQFGDSVIPREDIMNAVALALHSPSMCNRQTTRIYSFTSKEVMASILSTQLGDQGWCLNSSNLFVVTGKLSMVGGYYERNQILVDGGMFCMSFVLSLQSFGYVSTCKMGIRHPLGDSRLRKIAKIDNDEELIMLILAGSFPDQKKESVRVPRSVRMPAESVIRFEE